MVDYIKYTPDVANNWSRAWSETEKQRIIDNIIGCAE